MQQIGQKIFSNFGESMRMRYGATNFIQWQYFGTVFWNWWKLYWITWNLHNQVIANSICIQWRGCWTCSTHTTTPLMPCISHIAWQLRKVSKKDIHSFMKCFTRAILLWSNHKANLTVFHHIKWSNRQWTRNRKAAVVLLDSARHLGLFNDGKLQVTSSSPYPVNWRKTLDLVNWTQFQKFCRRNVCGWRGVSQHMLRGHQFLDQLFWREQCYHWAFVRACSTKGSPGRSS